MTAQGQPPIMMTATKRSHFLSNLPLVLMNILKPQYLLYFCFCLFMFLPLLSLWPISFGKLKEQLFKFFT